MISSNPLLGPQWEPLGAVLWRLFDNVKAGKMFCMQTYVKDYGLNPKRSPFVQSVSSFEGKTLIVELSGNLQLDPGLTQEQIQVLEFYGWTKPYDPESNEIHTYDEADEFDLEQNPNFHRIFDATHDSLEIAEFVIESLVGVFNFTIDDFVGFAAANANLVASYKKLGRLAVSEGNPHAEIFAMPGQHLEMLEPIKVSCALTGPPAKDVKIGLSGRTYPGKE